MTDRSTVAVLVIPGNRLRGRQLRRVEGLPQAQNRQAIRANLLARATGAAVPWTPPTRPRSQAPSTVLAVSNHGIAARAPWIRTLRR